jgi:LPS export ABC transporter protein LptC
MSTSLWKIILVGAILTLLGSACKNDLQEVRDAFSRKDVQVETIRNFETLYSDSAIVRVKITGPTMLRHLDEKDPREEFPDGVEVFFYDNQQRITGTLTSNYAVRVQKENQIIVRDSVIWESVGADRLETEELIWDEQEQKVFTNKFVVLERKDEIVWGQGFESDQDFTRSRIKAIEGRIRLEE